MSDYADRRDAGIERTLAEIDETIGEYANWDGRSADAMVWTADERPKLCHMGDVHYGSSELNQLHQLMDYLIEFGREYMQAMTPTLEALADALPRTQDVNRHLNLPLDDQRRAILHRVQNRNTGPKVVPFQKRGRK